MTKFGHIWLGALVGGAIFYQDIAVEHTKYAIFWEFAVLFGSIFPDIDLIWSHSVDFPNEKKTLLNYHRGITHHFLLPIFLLIISLLIQGSYFRVLFYAFQIGVVLHIILDMFSPLGIPYGKSYHDRVSLPLYTTGKLSEFVVVSVITVIIGVLFLGFNAFAQEPFYQTDDFLYQAKQKVINIRKDAKNKKYKTLNKLVADAEKRIFDNSTTTKKAKQKAVESYNQFAKKTKFNKDVEYFLKQSGVDIKPFLAQEQQTAVKQILPKTSYIYIFMSSSVPISTWINYAKDIDKLRRQGQGNIGMVMIGFIGGAAKVMPTVKFIRKIVNYNGHKYKVPIIVDPYLFMMFNIKRVPVFVYAKNVNTINPRLTAGLSSNLKNPVKSYTIVGDWSLSYALKKFYETTQDKELIELYNLLHKSWFQKKEVKE